MFTYTFSRREKALLGFLAVVLVIVAWFMLVFQNTENQLFEINQKIAKVDDEKVEADAQLAKQQRMQTLIEKYKDSGIQSRTMPTYDNISALTGALNQILKGADTYSLSFDKIDKESSSEYVLRGVKIDFSCDSLNAAEDIVTDIAHSDYPCSVDSVSFTNRAEQTNSRLPRSTAGAGQCSASMHVTFLEKKA